MSSEFDVGEKELMSNWRGLVRSMWGDSEFKRVYLKKFGKKVLNDNPRSMKKYKYVTRYQCNICNEWFGSDQIEIDHLERENSCKTLGDSESFLKNIFFTSPDKLQILCCDKWSYKGQGRFRKRNKLIRQGCHEKLTHSTRYDMSFERAEADKEAIRLVKGKQDKQWLLDRSITPEKTQVKRREQIVKCILENND